MKAGLPADCWYDRETKIYSFQAQIFHEKSWY
jgi:AMMECR1 domain-containing protein